MLVEKLSSACISETNLERTSKDLRVQGKKIGFDSAKIIRRDEGDPMSYVIDASVAAKLFIKEDHSEEALKILDAHIRGYLRLSAPTLSVYELGNIFWKPQITCLSM